MAEIDRIEIQPDRFGWRLTVWADDMPHWFDIGDATQFHAEVDRTIGRWLADGPEDFHNAGEVIEHSDGICKPHLPYRTDSTEPTHYVKEN